MLKIIAMGGPVMYPILLCSVLALAIVIEKFFQLVIFPTNTERLMRSIRSALAGGRPMDALQVARDARGPIAGIARAAVQKYGHCREDVSDAVEKMGKAEIFAMERKMVVLDTLTTIAPLLGLLGTVTGIIRSFNVLAAMAGISHPSQLSGGIAEAMITTAAGLVVAIPILVAHAYLSNIIDQRIVDMNTRALELVSLASGNGEAR